MKALTVLEHIAENGHELGVNEVARDLGMDPSTVHRLMATLRYRGYLRQNRETSKYGIGPTVLRLARSVETVSYLRRVALPYMNRLVEATEETAHLLVLQGAEGVYVEKVDSPKTVRMVSYIGKREYLHCSAVGKAILAYLPDDEVQWIIETAGLPRLTPNTITDPEKLWEHLAEVRRSGYALDDEEGEEGIRCVGAPVFDMTGRPVAAISVAAPLYRTGRERLQEFAPLLLDAAREISAHMGYMPGDGTE